MTTQNENKLQKLFLLLKPGCIVTASWLESSGISRDLQKYYLGSGWLESFGRGAYKKPGDKIEWHGALATIQNQMELKLHIGGLTALSLQGYSHYFRLKNEILYLFTPQKTKLPKWFVDFNWNIGLLHKQSSFLPENLGIKDFQIEQVSIRTSLPERAIMECLSLAPQKIDLVECYHLFEGLVNLKPKLVSELLENCSSVKVKRLFLYMADKANHQWFQFLKTDQINLGTGNRILADKGVYSAKYLLSVPKELSEL